MDNIKNLLTKTSNDIQTGRQWSQQSREGRSNLELLTSPQLSQIDDFFAELIKIYGGKFHHTFQSIDEVEFAKEKYGLVIASFNAREIEVGMARIPTEISQGRLKWPELADILPLFDRWIPTTEKINKLWAEYNNQGIERLAKSYDKDGREYNANAKGKKRTWSSGILFEVVKRLGQRADFLIEEQGREAKPVFTKMLTEVLQEAKNGAEFNLPMALEDKSSEVKPREHYKEAGKAGHKDFMKQFKGLK